MDWVSVSRVDLSELSLFKGQTVNAKQLYLKLFLKSREEFLCNGFLCQVKPNRIGYSRGVLKQKHKFVLILVWVDYIPINSA